MRFNSWLWEYWFLFKHELSKVLVIDSVCHNRESVSFIRKKASWLYFSKTPPDLEALSEWFFLFFSGYINPLYWHWIGTVQYFISVCKEGGPCLPRFSAHRNIAQDGRSDKVSIFISFDVDIPPVQQQLCTLIRSTLDQRLHPGLGLGRDQGTHIWPWLITWRTHICATVQVYKETLVWKCIIDNSNYIPWNRNAMLQVPAFTRSDLERSTSSGSHSRDSPTKIAVERAMQRWPAAPKAAPTSWLSVFSLLASGITTPWFLAPWNAEYGLWHCGVSFH